MGKTMGKTMGIVGLCLLLLPSVWAMEAKEYTLQYELSESGYTKVTHHITISQSDNTYFELDVPTNSDDLSVRVGGKDAEFFMVSNNSRNIARIKITALTDSIDVVFNTDAFITDAGKFSVFGTTSRIPFANTYKVTAILPPRAILSKTTNQFASSFYPMGQVSSDGQHITVNWLEHDVSGEFSYLVIYKVNEQKIPAWAYYVGGVLIFTILAGGTWWYIKHRKPKIIRDKEIVREKEVVKEKEFIIPNLKEEEQKVVDALKLKEGIAEQGTLRVILNMPKATLSVLLKELEERKVIYKEKKGNKNLVYLKESPKNIPEQVKAQNGQETKVQDNGSAGNI